MRSVSTLVILAAVVGTSRSAHGGDPCDLIGWGISIQCEGQVSGFVAKADIRTSWQLINGTAVNPQGGSSASALAVRTGTRIPCWEYWDGPMTATDSSIAPLGYSSSASAYVPGTFLAECAYLNSLDSVASAWATAVTQSTSGETRTVSTSLFGAGYGKQTGTVAGQPPCITQNISPSVEPAVAVAQNIWGAEQIIPTSGTAPAIVFCFESARVNSGFDCVKGTPSTGWPSLGSFSTRVGHQVNVSMTANGSTTTTTGVQISGGDITPVATGLLNGSEPLECGTSTVSMPVPTGTPVSFRVTSRSVGVGMGGDLNGDAIVDCSDKPAFFAAMNTVASDIAYDIRADLDLDGDVDVQDLIAFIAKVPCCNFGCNPADIACDDGTPLLFNPGCANSNTGPNEGDYNAFFSAIGFFYQSSQGAAAIGSFCDIACDDGTPLCESPNCANSGVNEGDYNAFFNTFFSTCTSS